MEINSRGHRYWFAHIKFSGRVVCNMVQYYFKPFRIQTSEPGKLLREDSEYDVIPPSSIYNPLHINTHVQRYPVSCYRIRASDKPSLEKEREIKNNSPAFMSINTYTSVRDIQCPSSGPIYRLHFRWTYSISLSIILFSWSDFSPCFPSSFLLRPIFS